MFLERGNGIDSTGDVKGVSSGARKDSTSSDEGLPPLPVKRSSAKLDIAGQTVSKRGRVQQASTSSRSDELPISEVSAKIDKY